MGITAPSLDKFSVSGYHYQAIKDVVESKNKNNKTMQGKIKTLTDRGFGFIEREGETKDLFFHAKELSGVAFDDLKVGDPVTFEVLEGEKGPSATNVARLVTA
jgi:CspA family cold shock protein